MKRPRLGPGPGRPGAVPFPEEDEDEDDITEIREGEDSSDYYEGYEGYDEQPAYEEEAAEETIAPGAAAGPQLMGLLCPKCRQMCQGVQALKEHMQVIISWGLDKLTFQCGRQQKRASFRSKLGP